MQAHSGQSCLIIQSNSVSLQKFIRASSESWLTGGVAAVLVSVIVVLVFGEIIPQAVCTRYGLAVGANCAPLVRLLMFLTAPIAWPISKLLDSILGTKHTVRLLLTPPPPPVNHGGSCISPSGPIHRVLRLGAYSFFHPLSL